MRYAFIKYGDVIEELKEIGPMPEYVPQSGPKTFASNYLMLAQDSPSLMISCGDYKQDKVYKYKNVEARLYHRFSGILGIYSLIVLSAKILYRLLIFRSDFTVCVQDGPGLWSTYIASIITRKPFIHSRQRAISIKGDSWRRQLSVNFDNYIIKKAACVICHGPFTKYQLENIGVSSENIIDYDVRFDDLFKNLKIDEISDIDKKDNTQKILFLGRVGKLKGVFDLLDACEPILHERPQLQLIYVGDGYDLNSLREQIHQRGLDKCVITTGGVPHEEIINHLNGTTLMAMPTQHGLEGWGMSAVEALAMGIPVVAPNAGPFQFMINDGVNGLLYKVDSIEDLRDKLELILNNSDLRAHLSKGAVLSEQKRNESLITFGEALKLAHNRVTN